jgi:hypothetical protein
VLPSCQVKSLSHLASYKTMPSSTNASIRKPPKRRYQNVASHSETDGSDPLASQIPSPSEGESSDCLEDYQQPNQLSIDDAIGKGSESIVILR